VRLRPGLTVGVLAATVALFPFGKYNPYPHIGLPVSQVARSCDVLGAAYVSRATGQPVRSSSSLVPKPDEDTENLYPSISISGCSYQWHARCTRAASLRSLAVNVIDMPSNTQATRRFAFAAQELYTQSNRSNGYRNFYLHRRNAYELAIQKEVLVRVLDSHFIVDMHISLCTAAAAAQEEAAVQQLVERLRLPVLAVAVDHSAG
jgi:hypothetical protein